MPQDRSPEVRRLLEALDDQASGHTLLLIDPHGTIVWANRGAERILGCDKGSLIGRPSSALFVPDDVALGIPDHELAVARSQGSAEDERWTQRPDGSTFWATGLTYALTDEEGELIGYGKLFRNRTDWKEQQETLRNQLADLEARDTRKNHVISTLAHELRNPLAPLTNATHLLRGGAAVDYPIQLIERQVGMLRRLVDGLLEATRASAGKVRLERERLVLQEVIRHATESVHTLIDQRGQQFDILMPPGPIELVGDCVRLQQVFGNLLHNAARYTPPGGRIWLQVTAEGEEAVVRVEDNGIGIEPETLAHIFDLFAQVHVADTGEGGVGIGLAVVKELVMLHGGTVQATSDGIGRGSTFTVRLPREAVA
ncbi:MAG: PAS domain-containing sensor histidine kinase [Burkholderiaceae bacterium]|nr:PAS domain-containing sensor histidine kinase [Burkholderiaceae bacterium]